MKDIVRNALRRGYLPEMLRKLYTRTHFGFREGPASEAWVKAQAQSMDLWAEKCDPALWREAVEFQRDLRAWAEPKLEPLRRQGIDLGGGGAAELLYFLTRLHQPQVILETGVAAGWSTTAILAAIKANGHGHLYSSDFPYFRIADPERYIAYLVPEELKGPWTLHIEGDRRNLDRILVPGLAVDLCHYDSDKSRPGREWFARRVAPHLSPSAVWVWDDISDNLHFRDFGADREACVLAREGRSVGVTRGAAASS